MTVTQDPPTSRSPIQRPQLRLPGQSLDEQYRDTANEASNVFSFAIVIAILMSGWEWVRYLAHLKPQPLGVTFGCLGFIGYVLMGRRKVQQKLHSLKLGRDGEREVADTLSALALQGCRIYHDIPTGRGNIDHVIIGPFGVFSIETKTRSKRGRDPQAHYDGHHLDIDGLGRCDDLVDQAQAEARWLKEFLTAKSGKPVAVRPVLALPGWFVNGKPWEHPMAFS